jgi:hypothetical protein
MEAAPDPLEASRGDDETGLALSACRAGSPYALAHARTLAELFCRPTPFCGPLGATFSPHLGRAPFLSLSLHRSLSQPLL